MMRKISSLLTSFSLFWMPISMSYGASVMVDSLTPSVDSGTAGQGGAFVYDPTFNIYPFGVSKPISLETIDSSQNYRPLGPISTTQQTDIVPDLTLGLTPTLNLRRNPINIGTESCLNCTLTNFYRNQRDSYPNLTKPFSYFDQYFQYSSTLVAQPEKKNCIDEYSDYMNNDGKGENPICLCLSNSSDQPMVTKEDVKKYESEYNKNAALQLKERFLRNNVKIADELNSLRAAVYHDKNFNDPFSKIQKEMDPDAYKFTDDCQGDIGDLLSVAQEQSGGRCTPEGVEQMKNLLNDSSAQLLVDENGKTKSNEAKIDKIELSPEMKEVWAKIEMKLGGDSVSNLQKASYLKLITSLNISDAAMKEAFEKSETIDTSMDSRDIIEEAYNLSLKEGQNKFLESFVNGSEQEYFNNDVDQNKHVTGIHFPPVAFLFIGDRSKVEHESIHFEGMNNDGSDGIGRVARVAASGAVSGAGEGGGANRLAFVGKGFMGRAFGELLKSNPFDEMKYNNFVGNFLNYNPGMKFALSEHSAFDEIGLDSELVPGYSAINGPNEALNNQNKVKLLKEAVCGKSKGMGLTYCDSDKFDNSPNKLPFMLRAASLATQNLAVRCSKAKDNLINTCAAFSGKQPTMTTTDGYSFFINHFGNFKDDNFFNPKAKDEYDHKVKTAQLSCYFKLREIAIREGNKDMKCQKIANKFLDPGAKDFINKSEAFGEGCKASGNPNSVAVGESVKASPMPTEKEMLNVEQKVAEAAMETDKGNSGSPTGRKRFAKTESTDYGEDGFSKSISSKGGPTVDRGASSASGELPNSDSKESGSALPNSGNDFSSNNFVAPVSSNSDSSMRNFTQEEMKEIDPVKAAQISSNDQALKDLQSRLDESERKLNEKLSQGNTKEANQLSSLIAEMKAQREQMQLENEKLRKEMQAIAASKQQSNNNGSAVARAIASDNSKPANFPTPSSFSASKSPSSVANSSGSSSSIGIAPASNGQTSGSLRGFIADDYGYSKNTSQGPTLRLTQGELAKAHFVPTAKDIYSAILSAPNVPVFVREDGIIVKYVCSLDEDGKCELDKEGKPILTSYKFEDPEFDAKKVVRKPAAIAKPAVVKERKFKQWSEVESVIQDTVEPK